MVLARREIIFLTIIILATLGLQLFDFGLPAIWPDETSYFVLALSMLNPPDSDLFHYSKLWSMHAGQFPVQWEPYVGALSSYIAAPLIYLLGPNQNTVRLYEMLTCISIIVLTYFCGKELFSKRVGMISSSLLTTWPFFAFYSRQSITYEWILLSIALLIIILGLQYLKTSKIRYLGFALFLAGIGVYGYLWFFYFIFGFILTIPLWYKIVKKKMINQESKTIHNDNPSKNKRSKLVILSILSLIAGCGPLILSYLTNPYYSLVPFLLRTLDFSKKTSYLQANNLDISSHVLLRFSHFFDLLSKPGLGFYVSNLLHPWNEITYVIPIILVITTMVSIIYVAKKKPHYKKILFLYLFILGVFIFSMFTVSGLNALQLGILLPFLAILMARGIEIISINTKIIQYLQSFRKQISSEHIALCIVLVIILIQIPTLASGYRSLETDPSTKANIPYENLNSYLEKNNLVLVSLGWFTDRTPVFYSNGKHVPILIPGNTIPTGILNETTEKNMVKLESLNLLDTKYAFLLYLYPKEPDCSKGYDPHPVALAPVCADAYFVESAANRNHLNLDKIDFPLPDGTPYLRVLRFVNAH
jgi:hypothetical protein